MQYSEEFIKKLKLAYGSQHEIVKMCERGEKILSEFPVSHHFFSDYDIVKIKTEQDFQNFRKSELPYARKMECYDMYPLDQPDDETSCERVVYPTAIFKETELVNLTYEQFKELRKESRKRLRALAQFSKRSKQSDEAMQRSFADLKKCQHRLNALLNKEDSSNKKN